MHGLPHVWIPLVLRALQGVSTREYPLPDLSAFVCFVSIMCNPFILFRFKNHMQQQPQWRVSVRARVRARGAWSRAGAVHNWQILHVRHQCTASSAIIVVSRSFFVVWMSCHSRRAGRLKAVLLTMGKRVQSQDSRAHKVLPVNTEVPKRASSPLAADSARYAAV